MKMDNINQTTSSVRGLKNTDKERQETILNGKIFCMRVHVKPFVPLLVSGVPDRKLNLPAVVLPLQKRGTD